MKTLLILMLFFTLISCDNKKVQNKKGAIINTSIVETKEINVEYQQREDTIFINKTFLIIGNKEMKIDYLFTKTQNAHKISKGDTLYQDKKNIILGDNKYTTWIYKKYVTKFNFNQYRIDSIYDGKLALPKLNSINDVICHYMSLKEWKDYIKNECVKQGINFAGHFTIVDWGCGAACQNMCIVDRITGEVFFPDIPDDHIDGYYGVKFKKDSRMLITNYEVLIDYLGYYQVGMSAYPEIYEWVDTLSKRLE